MPWTELFPDPAIDVIGYREVGFSREAVWDWMLTHPCELLATEGFHARVDPPTLPLRKGDRILIHHELPLGYRERRYARINKLEPYVIGFGEVARPGVYDFFPHSYRFRLAELDAARCIVRFDVRGRFRIPGGRVWWMPWFQHTAPRRLEQLFDRLDDALRRDLGEPRRRRAQVPSGSPS